MDNKPQQQVEISPLVHKLGLAKESAYQFRRRRHSDWLENYTLARDKVQLNRLIQRQQVNVPLIKTAIKTLLKDIDDPPMLYFTNLDNDEQAEVYYNEYWKFCYEANKGTLKDIVDKRQVLLFGRSFKKMNIIDGMFTWEIIDPQDVLVDRYIDPSDIDSGRFIIFEHIYKPLASLRTNPMWDTKAVRKIQQYHATEAGLIRSQANQLDFVEKQSRMAEMGVIDVFAPQLQEAYVELNEFYIKEWNEQLGRDEIMYMVTCEDMEVLFAAPLEQVIGTTTDHFWQSHYPVSTWGDETERTDFWSDGVADSLRTLNKVMNAWFSQMIENRTMRNFGLNYYNSSMGEEGFTPQTFTPEAWGWYPIPAGQKNINEVVMPVQIPDLEDTLEQMNFIQSLADKASAATTTEQGVQEKGEVTLGELKLMLANSQERVKSMAIYYTDSWKDFGRKYIKMLEAAGDKLDEQTIHRRGRLTKKMYVKRISPKDWATASGFGIEVKMQSEAQAESMDSLQWLNAARTTMPGNPIVDEEYKLKILENSKISSEKISEALKFDKQMTEELKQQQQMQQGQVGPDGQPVQQLGAGQQQLGPGQPAQPQVPPMPQLPAGGQQ